MVKNLNEKLKELLIYYIKHSSFFYTGIKENKWRNIHFEFESAESGVWYTSGDEYLWEFTERWIYFIGLPIWRLYHNAENKGKYNHIKEYPEKNINLIKEIYN